MITKIFTIKTALLIVILTSFLKAQTLITPEPTNSSLQNYINTAISPATGIPSITIPLFSLETVDQSYPVSLALSYHPYNAKSMVPASDVGAGWSLFKGSMIVKESFSKNNEFTDINNLTKFNADRFYYSIPGNSGKFTIYKDSLSGTLKAHNLSGSRIKVDFTRDQSSTKLIITSFTITDDKGYQYIFDNYNITSWKEPGIPYGYRNQRSSYMITSVKNSDNVNLVNYIYDVKIKYIENTPNIIKYRSSKLTYISTDKGKIKFEYDYDLNLDQNNDNDNDFFPINNISLLNTSGKIISRYKFLKNNITAFVTDYNTIFPTAKLGSKKALSKLQKLNSDETVEEQTEFFYNTGGSDTEYIKYEDHALYGLDICSQHISYLTSPNNEIIGVLEKIKFPTGGSVVYNFEANEIYEDHSSLDLEGSNTLAMPFYQYFDTTDNIEFDTNISRTYTFTVDGLAGQKYPVKVGLGELGLDYELKPAHGSLYPFNFSLHNLNNEVMQPSDAGCNGNSIKVYNLFPGNYTVKINYWGGTGKLIAVQLKNSPKPYRSFVPVKMGARIKRITHYDENNDILKQKEYEYNVFTDPNSSSGYQFSDENSGLGSDLEGFVLYRNVREKEIVGNHNNGYIDYYFDTPEDYRDLSGNIYYNYYNLTSQGILKKKKTYNSDNQIVESSEFQYNFQNIPGSAPEQFGEITSYPSWIQYMKETTTSKLGQSDYTGINEHTYNPENFQTSTIKSTGSDGTIIETLTKYATEMGDTRLINANMISLPLQVETKTDGILMSKVTTRYDNTDHFYPTSLESSDLAQTNETQMSFDLYDNKGNLVQTTDKSGNSVTTIWGYYKTLPIAQIVGAKYNDISSLSVITTAINASNSDADDPANETALLTALENLRLAPQLQQYSVTVSTYDPLVGITNAISSGGIKTSYEYDSSGRLLKVKNSEGQVLKENQYNYKH